MGPDSNIYPAPKSVFKTCKIGYGESVSKNNVKLVKSPEKYIWVYEVPRDTQYVTLYFNLWLQTEVFYRYGPTAGYIPSHYSKMPFRNFGPCGMNIDKPLDRQKLVINVDSDSTDFIFNTKRDMTFRPDGLIMYGVQALRTHYESNYRKYYNDNFYSVIRIVKV